jgi:hypothetical protein
MNRAAREGKKYITPPDKCPNYGSGFSADCSRNLQAQNKQTWKVALQQGLKISKNNFGVSTRNPVHYGGILIPPYQEKVSNFGKGNTR